MTTAAPSAPLRHIGQLPGIAAATGGEREYAVFAGRRITFGELSRWVDQLAVDMRSRGVGAGDRVLILMPNCLEVIVLQLAAWRIGAVSVPVVAVYREHELSRIVSDSQPTVVATQAQIGDRVLPDEFDRCLSEAGTTVLARYVTGGVVDGWDPVPELRVEPVDLLPPPPGGLEDPCLILYTSGTTAAPKGARLSSAALIAATAAWDRLNIDESDVGLTVAPLAHIAGMVPGCLVPLRLGCRVAILPRWSVENAVDVIDAERATYSTGATVFLKDLVSLYERTPATVHRIRRFVLGGSAVPPSVVERAEAQGISASRAYGMTETAGVIAMAEADAPLDRRANYDGRLLDDVTIRIVGDDGEELPFGVEGNLLIRGPQLLLDYTDPIATSCQLRDGWFDPGDLGRLTQDRWLQITGRTKDIINRGGEKFSTSDIEQAILMDPALDGAAVVAVPDERFGEAVCAFVTTKPGSTWNGVDFAVNLLLEQRLAKAKIPVEWHLITSMPTSATGKIQKSRLLELREESKDA